MGLIKGTPYPVINHPKGYLHSDSDEIDQIKSNMLSVLLTKPGERLFEPAFGLSLDKIDKRQPLPLRIQQTRRAIALALKRWEPRVQVTDVVIDTHEDSIIGYTVTFINPLYLQKRESMSVSIL